MKAQHHNGKGIANELKDRYMITEKELRKITNKMPLNNSKLTALERTNGDLKKNIGTLETTISNMKIAHDKMVEFMKEHVTEHKLTNAKINILYENRYGDKDPKIVHISRLTATNVTMKTFESYSAQLETAKSMKQPESNVQTLFSSQDTITQDLKLISEASFQTREYINIMLINQQ